MPFLTIPGVGPVPIRRDGASLQPDGPGGKRRWTFQTGPVFEVVARALVDVSGAAVATGAESERAWDGTLLTDRPLIAVSGSAFGLTGRSIDTATVLVEITVGEQAFRSYDVRGDGELPGHRRGVTLTLREA